MLTASLSLQPIPDFYFKNMSHFAIDGLFTDHVGTITEKSNTDYVASCYPMKGLGKYYGNFPSYEAAIAFIKEGVNTYLESQLKLKL